MAKTYPGDRAYWLLIHPEISSEPVVHRKGCYICEDPEFALMGLPLCQRCPQCGGHVPADDNRCDDCGAGLDGPETP